MKTITIKRLLEWAFTEELIGRSVEQIGPERVGSAWGAFEAMERLGCIIQGSGTPSDQLRIYEPHEDALTVASAVADMAHETGIVSTGANIFPDWIDAHGVIAAEVERLNSVLNIEGPKPNYLMHLVISSAILGRGPDWHADTPRVVAYSYNGKTAAWFIKRRRQDAFGRWGEYEDDGFDYRKRRPYKGAYHKYRLDGSIRGAMTARIDWQVWQSALLMLRDSLAGSLKHHDLLPFHPDLHPWLPSRSNAAAE